MTSEQYRTYLTESIKIGAQMMHDMAEDIAGRSDLISNLKVTIEFDPEMRSIPDVTTTLKDISTDKVHYVKLPENHIVIDFDIPDESGEKSFEANLAAASKWPATYAELSKSGKGIHLHYIYTGQTLGRFND